MHCKRMCYLPCWVGVLFISAGSSQLIVLFKFSTCLLSVFFCLFNDDRERNVEIFFHTHAFVYFLSPSFYVIKHIGAIEICTSTCESTVSFWEIECSSIIECYSLSWVIFLVLNSMLYSINILWHSYDKYLHGLSSILTLNCVFIFKIDFL